MDDETARAMARQIVGDRMVQLEIGPYELARKADVDPNTVGDFVNGRRWPHPRTRHKVALALGWPPEGIDMAARGEDPLGNGRETVGAASEDAGVLLDMPPEALEGLGPAERAEIIAGAKQRALEIARELRRRLGE